MNRVAAARALIAAAALSAAAQEFRLPRQPLPAKFGNVTISRGTAGGPMKPVVFAHWSHRMRYTCRVCHLELDFAMRRNATEITEEAIRKGEYCGACHDGKTAFASEGNCARCHSAPDGDDSSAFTDKTIDLPMSRFGNRVDWSRALAQKQIAPVPSLTPGFEPLLLDTTLSLEAEWNFVPPAIFPHREHVLWLDCANCHPSIFNVKKKTTRHFSMRLNLALEFCGVCHVRVAFPLNDCKRCHPTMKQVPLGIDD